MSRRSSSPRFRLLILILASATILTLNYRSNFSGVVRSLKAASHDVFAPVQSVASAAFRPVGNLFESAAHYSSLKSENARLRQEVGQLQGREMQASAVQAQLAQLMAMDHLTWAGGLGHIAAQVVSTASSNFVLTIVLNKGSQAGVKAGMPVVTGAGLVGRVVEVSDSRSTVLLITDPTSSVGVRFGPGPTQSVAVASGTGSTTKLNVSLVEPSVQLSKGEPMVTSGLQKPGDLFPPDIPVGTVASASYHNGDLQQNVSLATTADLSRLDLVAVLKWTPPGP
ncbi:MAG: rod shape-determining protein MreC [Acidimicrobiales bacterium]